METKYPAVLKSSQVCEILNVAPRTLDRLVAAGTVRPLSIKGMRHRRFAAAAVMKLIQG